MDEKEAWVRFAAEAIGGLTAHQASGKYGPDELAQFAAAAADALVDSYRDRFPPKPPGVPMEKAL